MLAIVLFLDFPILWVSVFCGFFVVSISFKNHYWPLAQYNVSERNKATTRCGSIRHRDVVMRESLMRSLLYFFCCADADISTSIALYLHYVNLCSEPQQTQSPDPLFRSFFCERLKYLLGFSFYRCLHVSLLKSLGDGGCVGSQWEKAWNDVQTSVEVTQPPQ